MDIYDYADAINVQLVITRYPNQGGRFTANFPGAEVKTGRILGGTYGDAKTADAAVADYAEKISGTRLVFDAYKDSRRESTVPTLDVRL